MSASPDGTPSGRDPAESGWLVWAAFGGVVILLTGALEIVAGLLALLRPAFFALAGDDVLVAVEGWVFAVVHIAWGAVLGAVGAGVLRGRPRARVAGIVLAALSALGNLAYLGAQPVWMSIMVAFDLLVVYALAVHGSALRRYA